MAGTAAHAVSHKITLMATTAATDPMGIGSVTKVSEHKRYILKVMVKALEKPTAHTNQLQRT